MTRPMCGAARRLLVWLLGLGVLAACACRDAPGSTADLGDAGLPGSTDAAYGPPRADLVAAVGAPGTLDIATWNIENFPATRSTPSLVADLITSLDLDLVAVQEIASVSAFAELDARLPEHEGVLSPHVYGNGNYQKLGFLYRSALLELADFTLLFTDDSYAFPRPPVQGRFVARDGSGIELLVIDVHLKAGGDASDVDRRIAAMQMLDAYLAPLAEEGRGVLVLGDFNEPLDLAGRGDVWQPVLDRPERYLLMTGALAERGDITFLPSRTMLDHMVATQTLSALIGNATTVIPRLDRDIVGFIEMVSDHLPVVTSVPLPTAGP